MIVRDAVPGGGVDPSYRFPSRTKSAGNLAGLFCANEKHSSDLRLLSRLSASPAPPASRNPRPRPPRRRPRPRRAGARAKPPLRIAYSDWPGWTAFEVGIQKGWFKEAGVDVEFAWFEYAAVDGGVRRRQGRRRHDDQRRRAGHRRAPARKQQADPDHRLQQRQRHDRRQAGHQAASRRSRARRSASRLGAGRAPAVAQGAREERA